MASLAEEYGASLVLFARQWTREPDDALQEALIDLLRIDVPPRDPVAWLFTTVKRRAMNHLRGETRRRKHTELLASERECWFNVDPSQAIAAQEACETLESLPDLDRQIVVAKIWGKLNFEQIAAVIGQSRSTIHRRYQSALSELANHLTKSDKQPPSTERSSCYE